ncbi:hypothetical protein A3F07_00485 [candidate division WWE3 bacterium RIFCSPHIGHO2_12_FULL_38_15]|uniref:HTH cro/C1-type domain-containing protein n=1 Tax=candidate division WWE3 bacterium RIFCSPHIGHO2_02_FULL_38_14 TaxID=1802620 RepID=A0A1F4VB16_UNCKA|nr:MAG: hypothetical protein A2793_00575 [candidate division WWE3 bacterium RIFCSPHIGHO2_01_FULL_38_45]OGC49052.1 MAG: hypothetical protein A3F07_00485 [candidate division WWE3 bacterium RIFCSPHIGHO2_12_FULL_38_15]OGC53507.1 MAG: hypothetical protein A3B64_04120 [candidate division WWE3 bacterium RIFCSPLOWO2_01_FULL_37_24]OGC54411.1 MAG: hypothetical protein A3D91_00750 [candidate division WWE3 bacterium RIFCSPHIGHO2_02_FULL_38_14]HLB51655.1 helix-turn-helix transcriptional regulator [Patesciba
MNNINKKIKKLRESKNLSQERFGRKLGLSGKTISSYETGRCIPPLYILDKISFIYKAELFEVNEDTKCKLKQALSQLQELIKSLEIILLSD